MLYLNSGQWPTHTGNWYWPHIKNNVNSQIVNLIWGAGMYINNVQYMYVSFVQWGHSVFHSFSHQNLQASISPCGWGHASVLVHLLQITLHYCWLFPKGYDGNLDFRFRFKPYFLINPILFTEGSCEFGCLLCEKGSCSVGTWGGYEMNSLSLDELRLNIYSHSEKIITQWCLVPLGSKKS